MSAFNILRQFARRVKATVEPIDHWRAISPFNYYVLLDHPLIVLTTTTRSLGRVVEMAERLNGRTADFIVGFSWTMARPEIAIMLKREAKRITSRFPNVRIVFLCNAREEYNIFTRYKIHCEFVNKNCFLDERIYRIEDGCEKRFDAIMNARMMCFKRHLLAKEVPQLLMITSGIDSDPEYFAEVQEQLKNTTWANYRVGEYERLSAAEVSSSLNQAKVGLILSRVEGQCQASAEYLLCGLPVVTTPSRGGRDVFFDIDYVTVVEADATAVRDGVTAMKSCSISAVQIRERTLQKFGDHRTRFCELLNRLSSERGGKSDFSPTTWFDHWDNKLKKFRTPDEFASQLVD